MSTLKALNLYINASGFGSVNSNGGGLVGVKDDNNKVNDNATLGIKVTNLKLSDRMTSKEGNEYYAKTTIDRISNETNRLYVSYNAARREMRKDYEPTGSEFALTTDRDIELALMSHRFYHGYMVTSKEALACTRPSALAMSDLLATKQNITTEVRSNAGSRLTKTGGGYRYLVTSPGLNKYVGVVRIILETLQFVCMDYVGGKAALPGSKYCNPEGGLNANGERFQAEFNDYLKLVAKEVNLPSNLKPEAKMGFYVRTGSSTGGVAQFGLKLNDAAVKALILKIQTEVSGINSSRASGTLQVDAVTSELSFDGRTSYDFLDSGDMGNIKAADSSGILESEIHQYFVEVSPDSPEVSTRNQVEQMQAESKDQKDAKKEEVASKKSEKKKKLES